MRFDPEKVRQNIRAATTEDLLDRYTFDQAGMEPEALDLIEEELRRRGVTEEQMTAHVERIGRDAIRLPDGTAAQCSLCRRPAVAEGWGWHRLWGLVPLFPRRYFWCAEHCPR
jgi:hypothetical protein